MTTNERNKQTLQNKINTAYALAEKLRMEGHTDAYQQGKMAAYQDAIDILNLQPIKEPTRTQEAETNHTYEIRDTDGSKWGLWTAQAAWQAADLLMVDAKENPGNYTGKPDFRKLLVKAV